MSLIGRSALLACLLLPTLSSVGVAADKERSLAPPRPLPEGAAAEPLLARWLREGDDREAAWAAWTSGERAMADLGPEVAARLGREVRRAARERRPLLETLLMDAALRLSADVPEETLRRRGFWTAGVVTYLCMRDESALHVRAFEDLDEGGAVGRPAWFALGGRLYAARNRAFAQRLLRTWRLQRMLRVWDEDGPYPPYARPGGAVHGDGFGTVPDGYPPIPRRRISLQGGGGSRQLVGAPFPVYAKRTVHRSKRIGWGYAGGDPEPDVARRAWLMGWLSASLAPDLPQWAVVDVKWSGGRQAWHRIVGAAVAELHDAWRALRNALVSRGLLSVEQCEGLAPRVEWSLRDERRLRTRPIPPMPEVAFEPRLPAPSGSRPPRRGT